MQTALAYQTQENTRPSAVAVGLVAQPTATIPTIPQQPGNFALVMRNALHIYPLSSGVNTIGRDRDCRIRLADGVVSRSHAAIIVNGNALILTDLHSTNGTFVNGSRITCSTILRGGDRVRLGSVEFLVAG